MRQSTLTFGRNLLATLVIFTGCVLLASLLKNYLSVAFDALLTLTQITGIFLALSAIMAFLEYRRKIAFERADMAIHFMLRFFENRALDDFRMALRTGDKDFSAWDDRGRLKSDVRLGMNFLEALAIAVQEGCFDIVLVDKMLGKIICELAKHPIGEELRDEGFSFEGIYRTLLPQIQRLHGARPAAEAP